MKKPALIASTLSKLHLPTLQPKLCQRASKANPNEERKQKIKNKKASIQQWL